MQHAWPQAEEPEKEAVYNSEGLEVQRSAFVRGVYCPYIMHNTNSPNQSFEKKKKRWLFSSPIGAVCSKIVTIAVRYSSNDDNESVFKPLDAAKIE